MLQSPPGATPAAASAMDKSSPCGSGAPGSSAGSKGQQPRSASAGPAAGESKPKGDGKNANGSKPRYNRKRETSYSKNENFSSQSRRSNSQKSKTFNKMPPQRGGNSGSGKLFSSSNGGRRDEVAEAQRAEFSPAQFSGPKKINLNHLLNFTFEPRGQAGHYDGNGHGNWGKRNKWGHKPFNKELFLQAKPIGMYYNPNDDQYHIPAAELLLTGSTGHFHWNLKCSQDFLYRIMLKIPEGAGCFLQFLENYSAWLILYCQFVVSEEQDYTVHFADPDTLVNWDFVEQVRICSHEVPSCPICLYPPTAAKITRCGHIFCWACILHYLSLSEKTWSKCPICYSSVHKKDLKSVVAMETRQYAIGDTITMQLMRREKGVLIALPKSQWMDVVQPVYFGDDHHSQYSKLLLASREQVLQLVILEEKAALLKQYEEEKHTPEACFIEAAIQELKEREIALSADQGKNNGIAGISAAVEELVLESSKAVEPAVSQEKKCDVEYLSAFDEELVEPCSDLASSLSPPEEAEEAVLDEEVPEVDVVGEPDMNTMEESNPVETRCRESKDAVTSGHLSNSPFYYFYQAEDGQCMYLHPVNVRCLVREYGSLEKSPEKITAAVVEITGYSMTEDIRQRHRYLCHLPLTCEFSICELALKPPIISKETLELFSDDLEKRKRLRQKKARDERRRERRIEIEENKKQGKYPEVHIALENLQQFPAFTSCSRENTSIDHPSFCLSPLGRSPMYQTESIPTPLSPAASQVSPLLCGSLEEESPFPSFAQMLRVGKAKPETWPKPAPKTRDENTLALPVPVDSDGESDSSDRIPVPSFQNSFSQAIEAALLKLDKPSTAAHLSEEKGGKRRKKQKQKLLFSTSVVHTK